jgi:hypothetical protein
MAGSCDARQGGGWLSSEQYNPVVSGLAPLLLLLTTAPEPLERLAFGLDRPAEVTATIVAACERCDWGVKGREAAVLSLSLDGVYSQHLVLFRALGEYRVILGPLDAGQHRLEVALDSRRGARETGRVRIESLTVDAIEEGASLFEPLAHAPILHARRGSIERFSDVPLLMWVEARATGRGRALRYSVVFSHEDGGTPADRLMATWGRVTDIELVYAVELDATGGVLQEEYQGKKHRMRPFRGRRLGRHPLLYVSTDNNMVDDRGTDRPRLAPAPPLLALDGVSREAVMDGHPWSYRVSAQELRREGRVSSTARPGSKRIPDPRRFAYLEACGTLRDASLAFEIGLERTDGGRRWLASDAGRPSFRVGHSGCFRCAIALPPGASRAEVGALRARAHTRLSAKGERRLPPGTGSARIERINRLFGLESDDEPGPSLFSWRGAAELQAEGAAFEWLVGSPSRPPSPATEP